MAPASVTETVTVVGQAQPFVETAQVATNFKQDLMATLPSNRTLDAVLLMAPVVHATGPRGAFTISGSQSYENLFTLERRGHHGEPPRRAVHALHRGRAPGNDRRHGRASRPSTAGSRAAWPTPSRSPAGTCSAGRSGHRSPTTTGARSRPFESTQLIANPAPQLKLDKTVPDLRGARWAVREERAAVVLRRHPRAEAAVDADHGRDQHSVHPDQRRKALRREADLHARGRGTRFRARTEDQSGL